MVQFWRLAKTDSDSLTASVARVISFICEDKSRVVYHHQLKLDILLNPKMAPQLKVGLFNFVFVKLPNYVFLR